MFKENFAPAPIASTYGTGFRGLEVRATKAALESAIGAFHFGGSADGKVQYQWAFQTVAAGKLAVVTVYDYKEEKIVGGNVKVWWHVGGNSTPAAKKFCDAVEAILGDRCEVREC